MSHFICNGFPVFKCQNRSNLIKEVQYVTVKGSVLCNNYAMIDAMILMSAGLNVMFSRLLIQFYVIT